MCPHPPSAHLLRSSLIAELNHHSLQQACNKLGHDDVPGLAAANGLIFVADFDCLQCRSKK